MQNSNNQNDYSIIFSGDIIERSAHFKMFLSFSRKYFEVYQVFEKYFSGWKRKLKMLHPTTAVFLLHCFFTSYLHLLAQPFGHL